MDTLSRLLSLYPVSTALTVRCHFGTPWILDHPQEQIGVAPYHLIVSGTAMLDGGPHIGLPLNAGDIVVFPKGDVHRLHVKELGEPSPLRELRGEHVIRYFGNDGTGPATDILCGEFRFDAQASATLLLALPEVIVVSSAGRADLDGLQTLLTMLRLETDAVRPGSALVVSHLSSALFGLVMRAWLEQPATSPGLFGLLAERRLQAAVNGMLAAPGESWTLERMAAACNMSRATFARVFARAAGATPAAILMQTRMARAAQSLAEGNRAVGDIGEAVGYQSEAAFNRVFKRSYGIGPGQYRRNARRLAEPGTRSESQA